MKKRNQTVRVDEEQQRMRLNGMKKEQQEKEEKKAEIKRLKGKKIENS